MRQLHAILLVLVVSIVVGYQNCGRIASQRAPGSVDGLGDRVQSIEIRLKSEIGSREFLLTSSDVLLAGQSYVISASPPQGRVKSQPVVWSLSTSPVDACLLDVAPYLNLDERLLTCSQPAQVDLAVTLSFADEPIQESIVLTKNVQQWTQLRPQGTKLYQAQCASCHGVLLTSTKRNASADAIGDALVRIDAMANIEALNLSATEIQSLVAALSNEPGPAPMPAPPVSATPAPMATATPLPVATATPSPAATPNATPTPIPTPHPGAALYQQQCASCHGGLASSAVRGRTSAQIRTAIANVGLMSSRPGLVALTPSQINSIASALGAPAPAATPRPTATPMPTPTPRPTAAPMPTATPRPTATPMPTAPPIALPIPIATPSAGARLYSTNCASCHGDLATSSIPRRTASQISSAISSVNQMKSRPNLVALTSAQISSIAQALGGSAPPPSAPATATPTQPATPAPAPPATPGPMTMPSGPDPVRGSALYRQHCASCHGELSSSNKKGRGFTAIKSAISTVADMKSRLSLTGLSDQDLRDITAALGLGAPMVPPAPGFRFLEARFQRFMTPAKNTAADRQIATTIRTTMYEYSDFIGGIYSPYQLAMPTRMSRNSSQVDIKLSSPMNPNPNSIRRGLITRACEEILQHDSAVDSFLARRGLGTRSAFDDSNVVSVFQAFVPGRNPSANVVTTLKALGEKGKSTGQPRNGWRLVIYSMCISTPADLL